MEKWKHLKIDKVTEDNMQSREKELLVMNLFLQGRIDGWNLYPSSSERQKSSSLGHWVVFAAHRVNMHSIWTLVSFRTTLGPSYLYDHAPYT